MHGVGGVLGTMLVRVFAFKLGGAPPEGVTMSEQLIVQALGVLATIIYCAVVSFIILKVIDLIIGLRVSPEEENEGLDHVCHDETGYNL